MKRIIAMIVSLLISFNVFAQQPQLNLDDVIQLSQGLTKELAASVRQPNQQKFNACIYREIATRYGIAAIYGGVLGLLATIGLPVQVKVSAVASAAIIGLGATAASDIYVILKTNYPVAYEYCYQEAKR
jgi:hypothetical protein